MTKKEILEALADMPEDTILEIHIEEDDGSASADFLLESIGQVAGDTKPPWFTFRVGEFVSDCG